jgi:hypothetical protein
MKDTKSHSVMQCYKADARIAELEADHAKMRAALEMVEWNGMMQCPWCLSVKSYGHKPNCVRQAALADEMRAELEGEHE